VTDDLKKAYETLGLPEGASRKEVEKRYELLLKKARVRRLRSANADDGDLPPVDLSAINEAYTRIIEAARESSPDSFGKKAAAKHPAIEKIEHIFYYYKFHMAAVLILIVVVAFSLKGFMDQRAEKVALAKLPKPDVTVSFFGDFFMQDPDKLGEYLARQIPGWARVAVTWTPVPEKALTPYDITLQQKSIIALMNEHPDVYVMDGSTFNSLVEKEALLSLDEYVSAFQPYLNEQNAYRGKKAGDSEPKLYGIDVTDSSFFRTFPIGGKQKIVGIRYDAEQRDNAVRLIVSLLQSVGQGNE
jgi:curved DNA-binding protein CbpA